MEQWNAGTAVDRVKYITRTILCNPERRLITLIVRIVTERALPDAANVPGTVMWASIEK